MWRMESRKSLLIIGQRDKLTAIFTGRLRGKPDVLVGTRIGHHLRVIQRAWPEVGAQLPNERRRTYWSCGGQCRSRWLHDVQSGVFRAAQNDS